ncbi:MAG: PIN domain-containing protein, partial [Treponema sp.]|nr:PIN domain-containing protein [Candidatus Treponema equi]
MSTMIKETSYLLDTNIISEIIKPYPDFTMIRHMSEHSSDMAISVLTWSELIFGVERLGDGPRKKHLMDFLYDDVLESF